MDVWRARCVVDGGGADRSDLIAELRRAGAVAGVDEIDIKEAEADVGHTLGVGGGKADRDGDVLAGRGQIEQDAEGIVIRAEPAFEVVADPHGDRAAADVVRRDGDRDVIPGRT